MRLLIASLLAPVALAAQERQVLTGSTATIYNLAGQVRLEAGSGNDVTVDVSRGGGDKDKLEVRLRGGQLVIRYPSDEVVYSGAGSERSWRSSTELRVRDDGTFGDGDSWGMGRRTRVRTYGDGLQAYADLVVRVPRGKRVEVHLAVGTVEASNVDGDIDIDVHAASIRANGTKGKLTIDAGSGSTTVENASGELDIDTGSGGATLNNLTMTRVTVDAGSGGVEATNVKADRMSIDVGSGGIRIDELTTDDLSVETGSGGVRLSLGKIPANTDVDAGSGTVTLSLPADANANLDIDTGSGGITSDFPVTADGFERHELRGKIGSGGPTIRISTGSGGVRLRRR